MFEATMSSTLADEDEGDGVDDGEGVGEGDGDDEHADARTPRSVSAGTVIHELRLRVIFISSPPTIRMRCPSPNRADRRASEAGFARALPPPASPPLLPSLAGPPRWPELPPSPPRDFLTREPRDPPG